MTYITKRNLERNIQMPLSFRKQWRRGRAPPPRSKFFQFHAVFGKFGQNRMLAPPWGVGAPSLGKYWIRHWKGAHFHTLLQFACDYCTHCPYCLNVHASEKGLRLIFKRLVTLSCEYLRKEVVVCQR